MSLEKLRSFIKENRNEYIELEKILTSHKAMAPENGEKVSWISVKLYRLS